MDEQIYGNPNIAIHLKSPGNLYLPGFFVKINL